MRLILIKDLTMKKVCVRMVLRNVCTEQKLRRKEIISYLSGRLLEELELLDKIVTDDETQVFQYDPVE